MSEIIESVKNLSIGFNSQKRKQISILRNVSTNIKKGETFTEKNISIMRPCIGIGADKINQVIGKKSTKNIKINTPITFSMLK